MTETTVVEASRVVLNHFDRLRVQKHFDEPSQTKQSFREESNINMIMAKYQKTGLIDHFARHQGRYEDLTNVQDYHASMNQILAANEAFASLPSTVRAKFSNDPGEFLEFVADPENIDQMVEMGLARKVAVEGAPEPGASPDPAPGPETPEPPGGGSGEGGTPS